MPFSRYPSGSCPCQVSLPFELRHFPAGSLSPLSRIEFVSYRLVVLLRLLPTPPHDDAVAVEYGPENVCPVGTFTLLFKCAYERTRSRLRAANLFGPRRVLPHSADHRASSHIGDVPGRQRVGAAKATPSPARTATVRGLPGLAKILDHCSSRAAGRPAPRRYRLRFSSSNSTRSVRPS